MERYNEEEISKNPQNVNKRNILAFAYFQAGKIEKAEKENNYEVNRLINEIKDINQKFVKRIHENYAKLSEKVKEKEL